MAWDSAQACVCVCVCRVCALAPSLSHLWEHVHPVAAREQPRHRAHDRLVHAAAAHHRHDLAAPEELAQHLVLEAHLLRAHRPAHAVVPVLAPEVGPRRHRAEQPRVVKHAVSVRACVGWVGGWVGGLCLLVPRMGLHGALHACKPNLVWLLIVMSPTPGGRSVTVRIHVSWLATSVVLSTLRNSFATPAITPSVADRPHSPHGGDVMRSSRSRSRLSIGQRELGPAQPSGVLGEFVPDVAAHATTATPTSASGLGLAA
jgi:hypothetical protein